MGLASVEVGERMPVGICLNPAALCWYWNCVGGMHTPSAAHSSTCVNSVRLVVGPWP